MPVCIHKLTKHLPQHYFEFHPNTFLIEGKFPHIEQSGYKIAWMNEAI